MTEFSRQSETEQRKRKMEQTEQHNTAIGTTQQLTVFHVLRQILAILPLTMSYISMTWGSASFAQKCPSEGNVLLVYFKYISESVLSYFYLSKEVESVLLLLPESFCKHKYIYFYLSKDYM